MIPTATGVITNTASVSGDELDPDPSDNTVTQTTFVSGVDLSIAKTDDPDPVLVGDALTYTLAVTNNGPSISAGVTTTDVLPSSVVFVSVTSTAGTCTESGGTVSCSLGSLAVGETVTSTVVVIPTATGVITNTASVSGDELDPDPSDNTVTQTTFVSGVDLSIAKTDDPDPVLVGDALTYTLAVTNNGPSISAGVTTTDVLPSSVVFVSVTSTAGTCTESGGTVSCSLGSLAVGQTVTSTIVVIPTATGTITNTASVSGNEPDPDSSNNTVAQTTFVSGADLSIAKTDDPDPVLVGDTLTYTLTVTNNGPAVSTGVTTTDVLPSSVVFVSVTSTAGACAESGGVVTCSLGGLAVGDAVTSTIVVIPTAAGTITNAASVSGNEPDPDSSNNSVTQTTFVSGADLAITKTDDRDPVLVLDALTYTLTVTNNGPAVSTGITTTDVLPSSVVFVSVTSTAGACAESGGVVTCSLGGLAVGDAVTSTIVVIPTAAGTITNTASVSGNEPDPDSSNNSATQATVVGGADLAITKGDDRDPVLVLDALIYTLTVTNNGPAVSTGVTTTDVLPSSVVFVSVTSTAGACAESGGVVTCSLGGLAVGDTVTSTIVVIPTAAGVITNTASVSGNEPDPDSSNNTAVQTTVVGGADLAITKTDDPDPVLVGDALTYTLTVTNNGPAASTGVTTTDVLPSSVVFVSVTSTAGTCSESGGTVTCALGTLAAGDTVTTTVVVIPTAAGVITNTASVAGNEPDHDSSNNLATQTTVGGGADLAITKSDDPDPVLVGDALTYTLTVTNNGPAASTGVTTTDVLPSSVVFVSVTSTAGTCTESGGVVTCSLGGLAVGETVTSTIVVIPTAAGVITNTASVSGNESDPDSSNNTAVQTTVVGGADLAITKTDDPDPVLVGDALTYTLTVTNNGPAVSTGVTTTDVLPSSVVFVSVTSTAGTCTESGGVVTCGLGGLPVGETVTSTIVVIPTAAGVITNTASVSGNESDPDSSNNTAVQATVVGQVVIGDCECARGKGFWKHAFGGRGNRPFDRSTLEGFLATIRSESAIFDEVFALSGIADASRILNPDRHRGNGNRGNGNGGNNTASDPTMTGKRNRRKGQVVVAASTASTPPRCTSARVSIRR